MRWAGYVARMENAEVLSKFLQVHLQERDLKVGLGVDGRVILEWILKKQVSIRFGTEKGLLESPCEYGIKPPGLISHGASKLLFNFYSRC